MSDFWKKVSVALVFMVIGLIAMFLAIKIFIPTSSPTSTSTTFGDFDTYYHFIDNNGYRPSCYGNFIHHEEVPNIIDCVF